jgi:hypothetical protein
MRKLVLLALVSACSNSTDAYRDVPQKPATTTDRELLFVDDTIRRASDTLVVRCYKYAYIDGISCVPLPTPP